MFETAFYGTPYLIYWSREDVGIDVAELVSHIVEPYYYISVSRRRGCRRGLVLMQDQLVQRVLLLQYRLKYCNADQGTTNTLPSVLLRIMIRSTHNHVARAPAWPEGRPQAPVVTGMVAQLIVDNASHVPPRVATRNATR